MFENPTSLPPKRGHDHQIPFTDEAQIVKLRPYKYLTIQKNEIEKIIAEKKDASFIRNSCSFFCLACGDG